MTTAKEAHLWRHEIQHGPEGEANYAWVYDVDGEMVCVAKTHHAKAIVTRMNALASLEGDAVERVARMIEPHAHAAYAEAFSRNDFADQMTWINAVNQSRAKARTILATGLVPDEAAIRGDWQCAAQRQSLPEPADCDWPGCGCDPHAEKVIESLIEQGWRAPPEPLAWGHPSNRSYDPIERRAEEIYNEFVYDGPGVKPKWQAGGNGTKQDEARTMARRELAAAIRSGGVK